MFDRIYLFEGVDYVGKTTVINKIMQELRSRGKTVYTFHEPGSTYIGEIVYDAFSQIFYEDNDPEVLAMLACASRFAIYKSVQEILDDDPKAYILMDRGVPSTLVYQGCDLTEMDLEQLYEICLTSSLGYIPTKTFLLFLQEDILLERASSDDFASVLGQNYWNRDKFWELQARYRDIGIFLEDKGWEIVPYSMAMPGKVVDDILSEIE